MENPSNKAISLFISSSSVIGLNTLEAGVEGGIIRSANDKQIIIPTNVCVLLREFVRTTSAGVTCNGTCRCNATWQPLDERDELLRRIIEAILLPMRRCTELATSSRSCEFLKRRIALPKRGLRKFTMPRRMAVPKLRKSLGYRKRQLLLLPDDLLEKLIAASVGNNISKRYRCESFFSLFIVLTNHRTKLIQKRLLEQPVEGTNHLLPQRAYSLPPYPRVVCRRY